MVSRKNDFNRREVNFVKEVNRLVLHRKMVPEILTIDNYLDIINVVSDLYHLGGRI